jgi:hypothetical protein
MIPRDTHTIIKSDDREDDDYIDLKECAKRMGLTVAQVTGLVRCGALRSIPLGFGAPPLVQPAILSGSIPLAKGK